MIAALEGAGFTRATVTDVACFIDGERGGPRDAVRLLFAGEKVRESHPLPTADVTERVDADDYAVVLLEASWLAGLVPEHAARLKQLIDDPLG